MSVIVGVLQSVIWLLGSSRCYFLILRMKLIQTVLKGWLILRSLFAHSHVVHTCMIFFFSWNTEWQSQWVESFNSVSIRHRVWLIKVRSDTHMQKKNKHTVIWILTSVLFACLFISWCATKAPLCTDDKEDEDEDKEKEKDSVFLLV